MEEGQDSGNITIIAFLLGSKNPVKYRTLAVRLPEERADQFESAMKVAGRARNAAAALRYLVDAAMPKLDVPDVPPARERAAAKGRVQRKWVYVTEKEATELERLAAPFGGVTAWFRGILEARLGRETELPAREEIEALHKATVQLGRLATNVNQIARVLNTAQLAGDPIDMSAARLEEMHELKATIKEVSARAEAVILAARKRVFNG